MDKVRLLEIFDEAMNRAEANVKPTLGWFQKLENCFHYRFRLQTTDLTSYQKYYHEGQYVGCIFDFTDKEKLEIETLTGVKSFNSNGFYVSANTTILPHLDYSPKRSIKSTIVNLAGQGSTLRLYDPDGHVVFEMPEMIDKYTLYPIKVIHSYEVKDEAAKLLNIWHL